MRGIRKGKPPSNVSPPGQKPRSFKETQLSLRGALKSTEDSAKGQIARAEFDGLDKASLRRALHREQKGLCVYCERKLPEPGLEGKDARAGTTGIGPVAHWEPIACAPAEALDWDNLHLSCSSNTTCDGAQKNRSLGLPVPSRENYEDSLEYDSYGNIKARASLREGLRMPLKAAIGTEAEPGLLNLNCRTPRDARVAALKRLKMELEKANSNKQVSREHLLQRASALLDLDPFPALVSLKVGWLLRQASRR